MNEFPDALAFLLFIFVCSLGAASIAWIWDEIVRHRNESRWQRAMDEYLARRGRR